jgi:hypothetical protein
LPCFEGQRILKSFWRFWPFGHFGHFGHFGGLWLILDFKIITPGTRRDFPLKNGFWPNFQNPKKGQNREKREKIEKFEKFTGESGDVKTTGRSVIHNHLLWVQFWALSFG